MIVKVHEHKVEIIKTPVNEQEVNVTKCTFEFDETIPNNYVKKAFFTLNGNAYEQTIVNNECDIPNEVLSKKGSIELGVVAYKVENEELIQRFNPSPDYFDSWTGSLKEAENTEPITPTDKEQIESAIAQLENDVEELDNTKQDTLVSGENIKTINNESLLGNGNINLNDTYYTKSETYNKTEIGNIKSEIENEIPTKISELDNDLNFIDKSVDNLDNYTKTSDLPDFSTFSLITETGSKIDLEINSSTYVLTAKLYDKNNTLISTSSSIDLPLETMVVGASYDSYTKEIILTLKNGQEVRFSVADLVSGLQPEITPSNKLASDLVDDTNQNNKFISQSEKAQITTNATNIAGIKNGTTINNFAGVESALNGKEDKSNKVNSIDSTSTDTQYPSAKCMYDSQVSQDNEISDLQSENDYINSIINQLPKVSSQGTILTLNNTIKGRMNIELGTSELTQDGTPTPDTPYPIHTISGNNKVVVEGSNLFVDNNLQSGTWGFTNGAYYPYGSRACTINKIKVVPNQKYVFSNNNTSTYSFRNIVDGYQKDGTFVQRLTGTNGDVNGTVITMPSNVEYINVTFNETSDTVTWSIIQSYLANGTLKPQMNKGETLLPYTPYVSQEANINLGDIEYCEIGDYKDRFERDSQGNWGIRKNIGKVVLDGSETWNLNETNTNTYRMVAPTCIEDAPSLNRLITSFMNNRFTEYEGNTGIGSIDSEGIAIRDNYNGFTIRVLISRVTDLAGFKTWLSNNNVIIYYTLATPTYTQITGTLAEQLENIYQYLLSQKEQTNISQVNNDLPFDISASALLDLNTLVGE